MGSGVDGVVDELPSVQAIKVHSRMCVELLKLVIRVSKVFPELEAARPGCSSGIDALCLLRNGIIKAKTVLKNCSESSALYLALTGAAVLSRCKKSVKLFQQSLSQIQTLVPVMLAAKISKIIIDLLSAEIRLDPSEEEAGRVLRELLHKYNAAIDSNEEAALSAIRNACSRLHICSQKDILIEKRYIRKMLEKVGNSDQERSKRDILFFFMDLLKKYGRNILTEEKFDGPLELEHPFPSHSLSNEVQIGMLGRPVPPEQFICPLSSRLMFEPVIIASGETYERMWIQKWFDEGNETCPKTKRGLSNLSLTSNTSLRDLIGEWCAKHGLSNPDPKIQEALNNSWEVSSNSIASMTSSLYDLNLPIDFSNISLGSSQILDTSNTEIKKNTDMEFLSRFSELPWDSRCNAVEDVKRILKQNVSQSAIPSEKFVQLILRFLNDAYEFHDVEAQMTGCLLLLEFIQNDRDGISYISEDAYNLLGSFLDTQVSNQALSILEALSTHQQCHHKLASSGAVVGMLNILESQIPEMIEPALKVLTNLSSNSDFISSAVPLKIVGKLTTLIEDDNFATYCIAILKNMHRDENGKKSITETDGCISSIIKLLEVDNPDNQECAVSILLSLCSQRAEFCHLVMDEGIFSGLISVSVNGNNEAKAMATELLRILKNEMDSSTERCDGSVVMVLDATKQGQDTNPPKPTRFRKFMGALKRK